MHSSLVLLGTPQQGERLTAHATGMPLFRHVDEEMLREVELVPEGFPAEVARVRLVVVQVQLVVPRQRKFVPELPATQGTLVGFFSRVDPLVLDEILLLPEAPVAQWAGEGPVTRMRSLVLHQIAPLLACVWAVRTLPFPFWQLRVCI